MRHRSQTLVGRSRRAAGIAGAVALAAGLSACSSSAASGSAAGSGSGAGATVSCSGVAGAHHARVVVESAPGKVTSRCVGFSSATISAATLLSKSRTELGTQQYSFGLAICQVDHVPAHYSQCLPSGADYWALFTSTDGKAWADASTGVTQITLQPGDSLGLAYDSPQGNPAPPPKTTPA